MGLGTRSITFSILRCGDRVNPYEPPTGTADEPTDTRQVTRTSDRNPSFGMFFLVVVSALLGAGVISTNLIFGLVLIVFAVGCSTQLR